MKNRRVHFSMAGIQCARRFCHSYLNETKKINIQFLSKIYSYIYFHHMTLLLFSG